MRGALEAVARRGFYVTIEEIAQRSGLVHGSIPCAELAEPKVMVAVETAMILGGLALRIEDAHSRPHVALLSMRDLQSDTNSASRVTLRNSSIVVTMHAARWETLLSEWYHPSDLTGWRRGAAGGRRGLRVREREGSSDD
jgi:hypothetical protein